MPSRRKLNRERSEAIKSFFPNLDLSAPILIVVNGARGSEARSEIARKKAGSTDANERETSDDGTENPEQARTKNVDREETSSTQDTRERNQEGPSATDACVGNNDDAAVDGTKDDVTERTSSFADKEENGPKFSQNTPPESSNSVTPVDDRLDVDEDRDSCSEPGSFHENDPETSHSKNTQSLPDDIETDETTADDDGVERQTIEEETRSSKKVVTHAIENPFQALSTRPLHRLVGSETSFVTPAVMKQLPKPTFRAVDGMELLRTAADDVLYGSAQPYYGREPFRRPEGHYVRYVEPTEMELAERVEYDMDEQDKCWLNAVNAERKAEGVPAVSSEIFERIMDRLEKEWFDLTKDLQKAANHKEDPLSAEDSACSICDDGECENSNAIVFCDGCNLAVHQDCYGIPYIPEGQWLCRKCMLSPENPVKCIFCPNEGGAFKQTTTSQWAHLLCALWIPEVGVSNQVYMEPIDQIDEVPKSRWRLTCYICKKRMGACIQCDNKSCFTAFHVTCARTARLYMRMKSHNAHYDHGTLKAYCDKHTPRDFRGQEGVTNAQKLLGGVEEEANPSRTPNSVQKKNSKGESGDDDGDDGDVSDDPEGNDSEGSNSGRARPRDGSRPEGSGPKSLSHSRRRMARSTDGAGGADGSRAPSASNVPSPHRKSKAAQAHQADYKANGTVIPQYIVNRATQQLNRYQVRKKSAFLNLVCRYWSLKREARRGAPLLKRLHLEPWTASSTAHKQTEEDKARKFQAVVCLRKDLEKKRTLAEMIRKREKSKLERAQIVKAYFDHIFYPLGRVLQPLMEQLQKADSRKIFAEPVSVEEVPDYLNVIKNPLDFGIMSKQLQEQYYTSIQHFATDVNTVYDNCMLYNRPDTIFYKIAHRLKKALPKLIEEAEKEYASMPVDHEIGISTLPIDPCIFQVEWKGVQSTLPKHTRTAAEQEVALKAERLAEEKKAGEKRAAEAVASNKATMQVVESLSTPRRTRGRNVFTPETPTPTTSVNLRSSRKSGDVQIMPPPLLPARRSAGVSSAPHIQRISTRRSFAGESGIPSTPITTRFLRSGRSVTPNLGSSLSGARKKKFGNLISTRYASSKSAKLDEATTVPVRASAGKKNGKEKITSSSSSPYTTRGSRASRNGVDADEAGCPAAEAKETASEQQVKGDDTILEKASSEIPQGAQVASSTSQVPPKRKRGRPKVIKPEIQQPQEDNAEASDTNDALPNMKRRRSSRQEELKRAEEPDNADESSGRKSSHTNEGENNNHRSTTSSISSRASSRRNSVSSGSIVPGGLVWAKMTGYPWFPAEVVDPRTSKIAVPEAVIQSRTEGEEYLVRYFDGTNVEPQRRSWKWVGAGKIVPFGASDDVDRSYLRSARGWQSQKKKVWSAFETACLAFGRDPARLLAAVKEPRSKEATPKKDG